MIAIMTKYLPCTNFKGSRIKAFTSNPGQSVIISHPDNLDGYDAHEYAAKKLMRKMNWTNEIIGGGTKDGYAFVMLPKYQKIVNEVK